MPAKRKKRAEPKAIRRSDIDPKRPVRSAPDGLYDPANPGHRWDRPLQAPGRMQVDFKERIDFRRLHDYRLARTRNALAKSGLGALLVFDQYNIRYISSTVIGEWARDKLTRWSLLTGNGEPWVWDFGSAARHHRLHAPWIPERQSLAGLVGLRGAVSPRAGLFRKAAEEIRSLGAHAVLVKGGHGDGPEAVDVLADADGTREYRAPRVRTRNTHGTGCTLSSAIAARLAQGAPLREAVAEAKRYLTGALRAADSLRVGHGAGPVHHFHSWWEPCP